MAFIRKRISPSLKKTPSYQVIETYRQGGKVKQRVLANLGRYPTPEQALSEFRKDLEKTKSLIQEYRRKRFGRSGSSVDSPSDRQLRKWSGVYARQKASVQRLEAFVVSGKSTAVSDRRASNAVGSTSEGFLDWVIDRNSHGWL